MAYISVTVFVDWKSQVHNAQAVQATDLLKRIERTLAFIANILIRILTKEGSTDRYTVCLRLYHGWYRGLSQTECRRAMSMIENSQDFELPRTPNIRFEPRFEYSELLLNALPHRRRPKAPFIHLPDTYRITPDGSWREKMVDTALACDLLCHARSYPSEWRLVLAEDDDLIPALYVAEAWSKSHGGRTILVRSRGQSKYFALDGILREFPI